MADPNHPTQKALQAFQRAMKEGTAPALRESYLRDAIKHYNTTLHEGRVSASDRVVILRNIGVANSKIPSALHPSEVEKRVYHVQEALQHLTAAKALAQQLQATDSRPFDPLWFEKVEAHLNDTVEFAFRSCGELPPTARLKWLLRLLEATKQDDGLTADLLTRLSTIVMNGAIQLSEDSNFIAAANLLEDFNRLFVESVQHSTKAVENRPELAYLLTESEDLVERRYLLLCVCESVKVRMAAADDLLAKQLQDEFEFQMIWSIIDLFHQSILLTREKDIENEALCLSRIGRLFHKVVKLKDKARECYRKCIELALTLTPRNMAGVDWYDEANEALQQLQREDLLYQDKLYEEARQSLLEEHKAILVEIDAASDISATKLLEHIYQTHPPKNPNHVLETPTARTMKKVLLRAVVHYHPDKQSEDDPKWKFLCQEITKRINVHYSVFKS